MKKLIFTFIFTVGSLFTLPAFAWPEVDHMNMCGAATKVVRSYAGNSQGYAQRDRYLEKRGNAYYFRTNCPETATPAKKSKVAYKVSSAKKAKSVKKVIKGLRGGYDKHADCVRVDRLNSYGSPVKLKRRY